MIKVLHNDCRTKYNVFKQCSRKIYSGQISEGSPIHYCWLRLLITLPLNALQVNICLMWKKSAFNQEYVKKEYNSTHLFF